VCQRSLDQDLTYQFAQKITVWGKPHRRASDPNQSWQDNQGWVQLTDRSHPILRGDLSMSRQPRIWVTYPTAKPRLNRSTTRRPCRFRGRSGSTDDEEERRGRPRYRQGDAKEDSTTGSDGEDIIFKGRPKAELNQMSTEHSPTRRAKRRPVKREQEVESSRARRDKLRGHYSSSGDDAE
jgi:hypothetical protein